MGNYFGDRIKGSEFARVRNRWCMYVIGGTSLLSLPIAFFSPGFRNFIKRFKDGEFDDSERTKAMRNNFFGNVTPGSTHLYKKAEKMDKYED